MRTVGAFILVAALSTALCGQSRYALPLKENVYLTGNYGEVRPNHFHAGLDFRTDAKKNLPIYCVADGYVSRIKVGTHGYGKVLYVTHPGGLVSVYGHQYSFSFDIKKYVQAAQDMMETFEVELFPKPDELKVKQGEIIGYTGNTGDSGGPHLHFEIRDEKSEVPLNPMRFVTIMDTVVPVLQALAVYEEDNALMGVSESRTKTDTFNVPVKFGIGIKAYDLEQKKGNKNNIYKTELFLDDKLIYRHILDSISFDQARFVNTYCDYEVKKLNRDLIQKCYVGKNNELPIYKVIDKDGFIYLNDTLYHTLSAKVYDFFEQSAEKKIVVKRDAATRLNPIKIPPFDCLKETKIERPLYRITMPPGTLYNDAFIKDTLLAEAERSGVKHRNVMSFYGTYFGIKGTQMTYMTPFHKSAILEMKTGEQWKKQADRLCIVEITGSGQNYCGGEFKDGFVSASIRNFGNFKIDIDTLAPKAKYMKPMSKKKKKFILKDRIAFSVSDDLSGIGKFKLYLNDKFYLAEYEHKTGLIFFEVSDKTPKGKISVRLEVSDKKNNKTSISQTLVFE